MMYMVMLVLDDPSRLDAVLEAWEAIGVSGATIAETSGINRRRVQKTRIPARYIFGQIVEGEPESHYTLFTIVKDENVVEGCLAAAERIVGDLDGPNTGVFAAWPLARVKGVPGQPQVGAPQ